MDPHGGRRAGPMVTGPSTLWVYLTEQAVPVLTWGVSWGREGVEGRGCGLVGIRSLNKNNRFTAAWCQGCHKI
jgi:hypothetical protein